MDYLDASKPKWGKSILNIVGVNSLSLGGLNSYIIDLGIIKIHIHKFIIDSSSQAVLITTPGYLNTIFSQEIVGMRYQSNLMWIPALLPAEHQSMTFLTSVIYLIKSLFLKYRIE